ncbi:MAG: hypothetical protein U0414_44340 [Polyangiaceae bacterium]
MSAVVRRGSIKVDAMRAADKIREHLLAEPEAWLAEVVRAAKLSGATRVDVAWDADDLWVAFDGAPWPARVVDRLETCVVADGETSRAARLVAVGVFAALGHEARFVDVVGRVAGGEIASRRYRTDLEGAAEAAAPDVLARLDATHTTLVHVRRGPSFAVLGRFFSRSAPPEVGLLAERLRSEALPVFVDGEPIWVPERAPVLASAATDEGSHRVELQLVASAEAPPAIEIVELGVLLARVPWPESWITAGRGDAFVPFLAVVSGDQLPTNVSRSKLRDDVLDACVASARGLFPTLLGNVRDALHLAEASPTPTQRALEDAAGELGIAFVTAALDQTILADPGATERMSALLDLPLLATATGAPRTLRVLGADRRLVVHTSKTPLDARYAPVCADVLWRRPDRAIDRILSGFALRDVRDKLDRGADRAAEALSAPAVRFGSIAEGECVARASVRPHGGPAVELALRASGAPRVRLWIHGRPFVTLPSALKLLPVDADIAWDGVLEADIEYVGLSCADGVVKRVEACLLDVLFGAISHADRSVAALHGPVLRRVSAAYPAEWNVHAAMSLPIWPRLGAALPLSTNDAATEIRLAQGFRFVAPGAEIGPHLPAASVFVLDEEERAALSAHVPHTSIAVEYSAWSRIPPSSPDVVRAKLAERAMGTPMRATIDGLDLHFALTAERPCLLHLHRGEFLGERFLDGALTFAVESDATLPIRGRPLELSYATQSKAEILALQALVADDADLRAHPELGKPVRMLVAKRGINAANRVDLARLPIFEIVDGGFALQVSAKEIEQRFPEGPIPYAPTASSSGASHVLIETTLAPLLQTLLSRGLKRLADARSAPPPAPPPEPELRGSSERSLREETLAALARLEGAASTPPRRRAAALAALPGEPASSPPPPPVTSPAVKRQGVAPSAPAPTPAPRETNASLGEAVRVLFTGEGNALTDLRAVQALSVVGRVGLGHLRAGFDDRLVEQSEATFAWDPRAGRVVIRRGHPFVVGLVERGDAANLVAALHAKVGAPDAAGTIEALLGALQKR